MPYMHAYPSQTCDTDYYYKEGKLLTEYEPGSCCVLAPGNIAWKSDLEALRALARGASAHCTLNAVVAKYLINRRPEAG
jgi:hypothetical protein